MSEKYIIGIDIGGTNTDIVLVDSSHNIVKAFKTETTFPLEIGVKKNLETLFQDQALDKSSISGIFVGTTHATNAIVEHKNLFKVGLIRIAGHQPSSLRPCFGWPKGLFDTVFAGYETIDGGFQCNLEAITPFSSKQAKEAVLKLLDKGMESLAVVGVFSPTSNEQELLCLEALREVAGNDFPVSLSHEIGGIGFIERENAAILNAALKKAMGQGFSELEKIKNDFGLTCPLYITENDGSLIGLKEAIKNPLLTISSGPTNSFNGAARLAKVSDAVIVDVGGTTTDIGVVQNGVLKRSMHNATIGGITLNFRMPDVMSIGIGGGSYVNDLENGNFKIGPESAGKKLIYEALSFGGTTLTLTDVALATGLFDFITKYQVKINKQDAKNIMALVYDKIQDGICQMKGKDTNLPVIYVGGGAKIASQSHETLEHYSVANAYGAALAEFSETVDTVISLNDKKMVMEKLKKECMQKAVTKGACSNDVKIVDVQIIPYHYIANNMARVIVKASGKRRV